MGYRDSMVRVCVVVASSLPAAAQPIVTQDPPSNPPYYSWEQTGPNRYRFVFNEHPELPPPPPGGVDFIRTVVYTINIPTPGAEFIIDEIVINRPTAVNRGIDVQIAPGFANQSSRWPSIIGRVVANPLVPNTVEGYVLVNLFARGSIGEISGPNAVFA